MPAAAVHRYPAPPYNTELERQLARARKRLGSDRMDYFYDPFVGLGNWTDSVVDTGTVVMLTDGVDSDDCVGAVKRYNTGAGVTGDARQYVAYGGAFPPLYSFDTASIRHYRAARFRLSSTADADTNVWFGSFSWRSGVIGSVSTTKYVGKTDPSGGNVNVVSTVTIDNGWHTIESWWDGTSGYFSVDDEVPVAFDPLYPLASANQSFPDNRAQKVGNAVSHIMDLGWVLYTTVTP